MKILSKRVISVFLLEGPSKRKHNKKGLVYETF